MKRYLIPTIIIAVFLGFISFLFYSAPKTENKTNKIGANGTSGKITGGMVLGPYHQLQTDEGSVVVVGNPSSTTGTIKPEVTLSKWDSEVSMGISYPMGPNSTVETTDNTITWKQKDKDVYFKQISKEEQSLENPVPPTVQSTYFDKFEFDILLKTKPDTNVFFYNIDTKNLDFFYQPPLNEANKQDELTCSQTECKDVNGNIVNSRPENVVGSYAAYYKDGRTGDFSKIGGKNYTTGKAFHIFRPKITDAKGNSIWGTLNVNETTKKLAVTVDTTFLASATYPVTIDPTFGDTSAGASSIAMNNSIKGSYFSIPEIGTPTSMSAYIYVDGAVCFTGKTLISMADGSYKKIKDIEVGDKVKSYNQDTKTLISEVVEKVFYHPKEEMRNGYLVVETDNGKKVEITPNHPVFVNVAWQEARMLKKGDALISDQNKQIKVTSVKKVNEMVPVYNLEVSNQHNYFASFLVHNKPSPPSFLIGTQIEMGNSTLKNIEKIRTGDKVKSYNFKKNQIEASKVSEVISREHNSYLILTDVLGNTLKVTPTHPLFVNGKWKLARQIEAGDVIFSNQEMVGIKAIKQISQKAQTYNLKVEGNHNYFANGKLANDESVLTNYGDIASGSNILTKSGYKKVEDLQVGEQVLTYDPTTYGIGTGEITNLQIGADSQQVFIINNTLTLTAETSVYTISGEKKVKNLGIGDRLVNEDGTYKYVFSISQESPQDVYRVEVSGNHNLFVNGFLVHNGTGYVKTAIYQQSNDAQVITSSENTYTTTETSTSWQNFTITGSPNLTASTNYWLYAWGNIGSLTWLNLYYDAGGNGVNKTVAYGTWPDPLTGQTTDSRIYSIYATYTAGGTSSSQIQIKPGIKFNPGVKINTP